MDPSKRVQPVAAAGRAAVFPKSCQHGACQSPAGFIPPQMKAVSGHLFIGRPGSLKAAHKQGSAFAAYIVRCLDVHEILASHPA